MPVNLADNKNRQHSNFRGVPPSGIINSHKEEQGGEASTLKLEENECQLAKKHSAQSVTSKRRDRERERERERSRELISLLICQKGVDRKCLSYSMQREKHTHVIKTNLEQALDNPSTQRYIKVDEVPHLKLPLWKATAQALRPSLTRFRHIAQHQLAMVSSV